MQPKNSDTDFKRMHLNTRETNADQVGQSDSKRRFEMTGQTLTEDTDNQHVFYQKGSMPMAGFPNASRALDDVLLQHTASNDSSQVSR